MTKPLIVSAVRDLAMYERCISRNHYCDGCERLALDNRDKNEHIPILYNRVLDNAELMREPRWIVFCHEDFWPLEDFAGALAKADLDKIYGPIGGELMHRSRWLLGGFWPGRYRGVVQMSDKDGSNEVSFGEVVPFNTPADTLDCQCLIVHTSLVVKHHLRFDEHLSFDLYAEDFCLQARLKHGVVTAILPFSCQHYSRGRVAQRFFDQKAYLDRKYPKEEVLGCVGYTIGGGRTWVRRLQKRFRAFLDKRAPWAVSLVFRLLVR